MTQNYNSLKVAPNIFLLKLNLFAIALCFSFLCFSQSNTNCSEDIVFSTSHSDSYIPNLKDISVSWNFTKKTTLKELTQLNIEVQPLNKCWEALEGTNRGKPKTYKIQPQDADSKNNIALRFKDLNCKCFKWRTTIVTNTCETTTSWKFESFYQN